MSASTRHTHRRVQQQTTQRCAPFTQAMESCRLLTGCTMLAMMPLQHGIWTCTQPVQPLAVGMMQCRQVCTQPRQLLNLGEAASSITQAAICPGCNHYNAGAHAVCTRMLSLQQCSVRAALHLVQHTGTFMKPDSQTGAPDSGIYPATWPDQATAPPQRHTSGPQGAWTNSRARHGGKTLGTA